MSAVDKFTGDTPSGAVITVTWVDDDGTGYPDAEFPLDVAGWIAVVISEGIDDPEPIEFAVHPAIARVLVQGIVAVIQ